MKSFKFHVTESRPTWEDTRERIHADLGEFTTFKAAVDAMYALHNSYFFTWFTIQVKTLAGTPVCYVGWHHYLGGWYSAGSEAEKAAGFNFQEHLDSLKEPA